MTYAIDTRTLIEGAEVLPPNPDGTRTISWSEIQTFRACPRKHLYSAKMRLQMTPPDHTALGKGILYHEVLEVHYRALMRGEDPAVPVKEFVAKRRQQGRNPEVMDLVEWMYQGHLDMYGLDDDWEIIAVEFPFEFPLLERDGSRSMFRVKGKIDIVVRNRRTGRVFVVDTKTGANLPKNKELDLDDQFTLYMWGLRQLGYKPFAAIWSAARTTRNKGDYPGAVAEWEALKAAGEKPGAKPKVQTLDERFDRITLARTPREMDEVAYDVLASAKTAYSVDNQHERHYDTERCRWACGYTEGCLIGRKTNEVRGREFLYDIGFEPRFQRH